MAFVKFVLLVILIKSIVSQSDTAEQDKDRCAQLAQFTPNLCDNDVAKERCTEQCGENGNLPGKIVIWINLLAFCRKSE